MSKLQNQTSHCCSTDAPANSAAWLGLPQHGGYESEHHRFSSYILLKYCISLCVLVQFNLPSPMSPTIIDTGVSGVYTSASQKEEDSFLSSHHKNFLSPFNNNSAYLGSSFRFGNVEHAQSIKIPSVHVCSRTHTLPLSISLRKRWY